VAEKVGAVREGVLRNRLMLHGTIHDAVIFSLIPDDLATPARW
jgi:RimJ/RimL family protein N-acetyltransferase